MLSVAILHTPTSPERRANVERLLAALPRALVVTGHEPLRVGNRLGCWPGAEVCWRLGLHQGATHHLVLEDDAVLCDDFLGHVETLVTFWSAACLSLFRSAQEGRDCSVATVLPVAVIEPWLEWVATSPRGVRYLPHHDWLIGEGMRALGVPRLYASPSLVEHGEMASLLKHEHVRAKRFEQRPETVSLEN